MSGITWNDSISVGDATIDSQHKKLIDQINVLMKALSNTDQQQAVTDAIKFLSIYITQHFAYEERFMRRHEYPEVDAHTELHDGFVKTYEKFKAELRSGDSSGLLEKVQKFLADWWWYHITIEDKKYQKWITENPGSHPDEEPEGFHDRLLLG